MNPRTAPTSAKSPAEATAQAPYKIQIREGCTIVYGNMPLGAFLKLMREAQDTDLLDASAARMLGATAVIGPRDGLVNIRNQASTSATTRVRAQLGGLARRLDADAVRWLATGDQGLSSMALFTLLSGIRPPHHGSDALDLPSDAAELRQCRLMLEQVPSLRAQMAVLAGRTREPEVAAWAALAESWDDLCRQMSHEVPDWRQGVDRAPAVNAMLACFHQLAAEAAGRGQSLRMGLRPTVGMPSASSITANRSAGAAG